MMKGKTREMILQHNRQRNVSPARPGQASKVIEVEKVRLEDITNWNHRPPEIANRRIGSVRTEGPDQCESKDIINAKSKDGPNADHRTGSAGVMAQNQCCNGQVQMSNNTQIDEQRIPE